MTSRVWSGRRFQISGREAGSSRTYRPGGPTLEVSGPAIRLCHPTQTA